MLNMINAIPTGGIAKRSNKLKTKITLDLPTGNILENGIETLEQTEMKTVFKRI